MGIETPFNPRSNWAGNYQYKAKKLHQPHDIGQVQELVRKSEKVKALGTIGEIVNVSSGFARNFLFPKKFAVLADDKNSNVLKDKQKALAKKIGAEKEAALAVKKKIEGR